MLYNKIFSYVNPEMYIPRKSIDWIVKMPKTEFKDIIKLYIKLCALVKWEWYKEIKTSPVQLWEDGEIITKDFNQADFNYIYLSKWNLININRVVAIASILNWIEMIEEFLESYLVKVNPQLDIFREFIDDDFTNLKYVFRKEVYSDIIYITYENSKWEIIDIRNKSETVKFNKDQLDEIYANCKLPTEVFIKIWKIKDLNFHTYKKFLLNAMELQTKWIVVTEDALFMRTLDGDLKSLEVKEKNKQKNKNKLAKDKDEERIAKEKLK